ncbi:hypothetical protein [Paenibacillus melissococcoides]
MCKPIATLNSVLEKWASSTPPIIDFTVENLLHAVEYKCTYDYAFRFLMAKNGFELEVSRVYLCPDNHKAFKCSLEYQIDPEDLPICHVCGGEIINDLDHSFLVFNFTEEYLSDFKKKMTSTIHV